MRTYLLAIEVVLAPEWKNYIAPVKIGNLKDPEKIKAKVVEWEQNAQTEAINGRMTSIIVGFKLKELGTDDVSEGVHSSELVSAYDLVPFESLVLAFNARTRVSQAAIEAAKLGVQVPFEMFCKEPLTPKSTRFIDPILAMSKSSEDPDQFLDYMGISKGLVDGSAGCDVQLVALENLASIIL